jgi:hypothetical protein
MPKIYDAHGFRVIIWPNDHSPPHVHVFNADGEAVITLTGVWVREVVGMRSRDVARALKLVKENRAAFYQEWRRIHGDEAADR